MEEMKNLVIQTLETRGILGQIRAKLRSAVFKVVDDQDSKLNSQPSGCGLKWENPNLYKIKETSMGGLTAEMIREYMEYFRMDYSLSVFIPECSISPERLKKEEIHARLGLNLNGFNTDLPFLYFIINYFMESIQTNPEKVFQFLNKLGNNAEKLGDDLVMRNYYNYQANLMNEEEMLMNPNLGENNLKTNDADENNSFLDSSRNSKAKWNNNTNINNVNQKKENDEEKINKKVNNTPYEFEKLSVEDFSNSKKYYDLDDIRGSNSGNKLDNFEKNLNKSEKKSETNLNSNIKSTAINQEKQIPNNHQVANEESIHSEIYEEIYDIEDSFQKSADRKMQSSSNPYNISQSGGYDGTVDSNALEKYNYIEPVEK